MTRREYEAHISREMGRSLHWLAQAGYHSYPERQDLDGCGWNHVCIPENGEGETVILSIERQGVPRYDIKPFGER